jgi:transcriptional regulator with XRE-family HTH domain
MLCVMAKAQHTPRYRRLPAILREMREAAALTQRDLASRLSMTHVAVHKSETGDRRVDVTEFIDWCLACDVEPETALLRLRGK